MTAVLTPLSWIYGGVTAARNKMFDLGILPQESFQVPVVCIGNITVGGTGKTPHTEYVVSQLAGLMKVAVLSRGYKRRTRGFILANARSTPSQIGDEPLQIYRKFGRAAKVAVCENRRKGIRELMRLYPDLDLILLDDAFQHRYVKPKVSILLTEYNRPIHKDHLLPLGRLRESTVAVNRADMVIVTKCPKDMMPLDMRLRSKDLDLMTFQKLHFSRYDYGSLQPVFPEECPYDADIDALTPRDGVLLVTGIAHPRYFVRHFTHHEFKVKVQHFPDHHDFTRADLDAITASFNRLKGERKLIVTTEKDAVRLAYNPYFPTDLKPFVFYQPISVHMVSEGFIPQLLRSLGMGDESVEHPGSSKVEPSGVPLNPSGGEDSDGYGGKTVSEGYMEDE